MRGDLVVHEMVPDDDDHLWVPLDEGVHSRPLEFDVTHGSWTHVLRVDRAGMIQRHRHTGPVQGYVLEGEWHYLEHDWRAVAGTFVLEPPGETHTLVVPEGCDRMVTIFHVTGSLIYVDPDGEVTGYDDVFGRLELARAHFATCGFDASFVEQFVR